jgi:tetratricopeptide (TPR) repeat protein
MILGDIAITYLALGEKQQAFQYLNKRLAYERTQTNQVGEADALRSLGSAYQSIGDKPKALDSYRQALSILLEMSRRVTSDSLTAQVKDLQDAIRKLEN